MKCIECGKDTTVYLGDNTKIISNKCKEHATEKEIGLSTPIETVFLQGYGHASVERIKELERRVILPIEPTNGTSYYVGRKGENGKIQEREPSY